MKNLRKFVLLTICFISLILSVILIYFVGNVNINVYFPYIGKIGFNINQYLLLLWILGIFSGLTFSMFYIINRNSLLKTYEKRYEKMSVKKDEDDSRVKALEAKIKTLEIALNKALEKE